MKMQINSLTLDSVLLFGYNSKPAVYKNVNFNVGIMKKIHIYVYVTSLSFLTFSIINELLISKCMYAKLKEKLRVFKKEINFSLR